MREPTAVDLFCGAGGLSIGLAQSGFKVLAGYDNDPLCVTTMRDNPKYINHQLFLSDLAATPGADILSTNNLVRGELDLLAGGPPCQGFSAQRTVREDQDPRNLLVDDYADIALAISPKVFILENVPGLLGMRGLAYYQKFVQKMESHDYLVVSQTLNMANYGVPQQRKRVIVLGIRKDLQSRTFRWPTLVSSPPTVRDTIGHLPKTPADFTEHHLYRGHRADKLSPLNRLRMRALTEGQSRADLPDELLADCHRRATADEIGHRGVYGRMSWDKTAPTITARFDSFTRGQFGHPEQDRSISLFEGQLLQTFPADYKFSGSKVAIARQIGNAIPPTFARIIGKSVLEFLK